MDFLAKICAHSPPSKAEGTQAEAERAPVTIEDRYIGLRNNICDHLILAKAVTCNQEFVAIRDHTEEHCWFFLRKTKPATPVPGFDRPVYYFNERICHKPGEPGSFVANCKLVFSQLRVFLYSKVIPSEKSNQTVEVEGKDAAPPDDDEAPVREEAENIEKFLKQEQQQEPSADAGSSSSFAAVPHGNNEIRLRSNKGTQEEAESSSP